MDEFNNGYTYPENDGYFAGQNEKAALRRAAWAIAVPGMVFFIVSEFWGAVILKVTERLGFSRQSVISVLKEPGVTQILQIALSVLLLTVPFIICAKIAGAGIAEAAAFRKPVSESNFAYFLFGLGFCSFANIAVNAAGRILRNFGMDFSLPKSEEPEGMFGFLLVVLSTAVVPALLEEFAFRGIVFGLLLPFGEAFAVVASSAVFAVLHGNFEQIPFAFLVGLVLAFVRIKTGSVAVCMAIHAANNAVAVFSSYSSALQATLVNIVFTVYVMLALTLSVLGVAFLKGKNEFTFVPSQTVNPTKKIYLTFFTSPAFIIFAGLFFFRAVRYLI